MPQQRREVTNEEYRRMSQGEKAIEQLHTPLNILTAELAFQTSASAREEGLLDPKMAPCTAAVAVLTAVRTCAAADLQINEVRDLFAEMVSVLDEANRLPQPTL
jgi:hypothetical protein